MRAQSDAGAIWIPAELLQIVPYQMVKGLLSPKHMSEMIKFAVRSPKENANFLIKEGLQTMKLEQGGIAVRPNMNTYFAVLNRYRVVQIFALISISLIFQQRF